MTTPPRGLQKPSRLKEGATVALVAPAFSFDSARLETGRTYLEKKYGIKTVWTESLFDRESYFAGPDERRAEELVKWLSSPNVDAVIAVRGGYGCARIYPEVIKQLKQHKGLKPKILLGYSDLTILLNGLHQDLGWATFHGPVITGSSLFSPNELEEETFYKTLFTAVPLGTVTEAGMITALPGTARGQVVGGCLSLVVSSIGTDYEIDTNGKILFVEDVDERPYRLDRMATQLAHSGLLDKIRGLIIGQLPHCQPPALDKDPSQTSAIAALLGALEPVLKARKIPTIYDFPAGHGNPQITFPIGAEIELRADPINPEVEFLEAAVT